MSKVRKKEVSKTHSRIPRKQNIKSIFLKPRQIGAVEQVSSTRAETTFLSSIDVVVEPAVEL